MKRLVYLTIIAVLALLLVACGGEADEVEEEFLEFDGTDSLQWEPPSEVVAEGSMVEVTVNSVGSLEHNWVLVDADADVLDPDLESQAIAGTNSGLIAGGDSATFAFTAPEAGDYLYVCTVPGHAAAGMVGDLTIE